MKWCHNSGFAAECEPQYKNK
uniref:Uncharacterized protein n=1 Tax=Anguilla anguilla TaxID=7936 RepID=A0A0E9PZK0_ANGAN